MIYTEWEEIAAKLLAAYPRQAIPPETLLVYAKALDDLPAQVVEEGVADAILGCVFFPTIAEIRECAEARLREWVVRRNERAARQALAAGPQRSPEEQLALNNAGVEKCRKMLATKSGPLVSELSEVVGDSS